MAGVRESRTRARKRADLGLPPRARHESVALASLSFVTPEQTELFERLRAVEASPPEKIRRGAQKGFWSRVKEAFTGG